MDGHDKKYLFIDESGDPDFYGNRKRLLIGTPGFQPYLIMGMIETPDRRKLRQDVTTFMEDVKSDRLYNTISSINSDKGWYLHARGDPPEVRAKFFEYLRKLDGFKAHIIIAKKDLNVFNRKHNNNPTEFYFDVLHHLLNGRIRSYSCEYNLYLAQRGNNSLNRFEEAVSRTLNISKEPQKTTNCVLEIVAGREMPELSVIDYLIWAVQRELLHGEDRYLEALRDKYESIIHLYEG